MKLLKSYLEQTLINEFGTNHLMDSFMSLIEHHHQEKHRYYHTLQHLESMFYYLNKFENNIQDKSKLVLSILFHDIIYDVKANDNELKSALFAENFLTTNKFGKRLTQNCKSVILASANHKTQTNLDTNFFLDFDLNILGQSWDKYELYTQQIRQEYIVFPDEMYIPGRIKVLKHFTTFDSIYKTTPFLENFEKQAQINLKKELIHLQKQALLL